MKLVPKIIVVSATLLLLPGCRFSYELRDETGDNAQLGGANGDGDSATSTGSSPAGDGDGDNAASGGGDGDGDNAASGGGDGDGDSASGGAASGGGDGDGDSASGGAASGGAASGGAASGGAASGGAASGGAASGGAASGGAASGGAASGGAASGGSASGGSASGGSASGGSGGIIGDYHVTSSAGDAGPGTFRKAIDQAILAATPKTITFDPGLTIVLDSRIPIISSSLEIIGNATHLDFSSAGNGMCFRIESGTALFDGLEISGCGGTPLFFDGGTNHTVQNSYFHDNSGALTTGPSSSGTVIGPGNLITNSSTHCVFLNAPGDTLIDNEIDNCSGNGVFFGGTSDGSQAIGNLVTRANAGFQFGSGSSNVTMRYNTIARSVGNAITVGQATQMVIVNNILTHSSGYGINGAQANLTEAHHNLFFSNTLGNLNGSAPGVGSLVDEDPMYSNFASDDYFLSDTSPAIDAGLDTGEDRNGADGLNYWGSTSDLGYSETNY